MKKKDASSYVKLFKEKIEFKELKLKNEGTTESKGINFDNLADWDNIVLDKDDAINNDLMINNELKGEDVYRPLIQENDSKINSNYDNSDIFTHANQNNAHLINPSAYNDDNMTNNKLSNYDKTDLSNINNKNNNTTDNQIPIGADNYKLTQIKPMPGVIREEEDEYRNSFKMSNEQVDNYNINNRNKKDALDLSDRITNRLEDNDCNLTQNQMNELNEEANQMVKESKVKSYVERKLDKGINIKASKPEGKIYLKQSNNPQKENKKTVSIQKQNDGYQDNNKPVKQESNIITPTQLNNYPQTYIQQIQYNNGGIQAQPIMIYNNPYQMQNNQPPIYPFNQMPMNTNQNITIGNQHANYSNAQSPSVNPNYSYQQQQFQLIDSQGVINQNINQSPLHKPNKSNMIPQYCPKTIKEYKEKYSNVPEKKLGGLGANIGTREWEEKLQKLNKIKEYSSRIKEENKIERSASPLRHNINNKNNIKKELKSIIPFRNSNNKQDELLKNQLLHDDSLNYSEDENDLSSQEDIKESPMNNIIEDNIKASKEKGSNAHVNVIKKLKKEKEKMKAKDDNAKRKNNIYTTMKQPKVITKKIPSINSNKLKQPQMIKENNKKSTHDDELTSKFMEMPCNHQIENLLQNNRLYKDKVDKIKMYLKG